MVKFTLNLSLKKVYKNFKNTLVSTWVKYSDYFKSVSYVAKTLYFYSKPWCYLLFITSNKPWTDSNESW